MILKWPHQKSWLYHVPGLGWSFHMFSWQWWSLHFQGASPSRNRRNGQTSRWKISLAQRLGRFRRSLQKMVGFWRFTRIWRFPSGKSYKNGWFMVAPPQGSKHFTRIPLTRRSRENRLICARGSSTRPCTYSSYLQFTGESTLLSDFSYNASSLYSTLTVLYSLSPHLTQPSGLETLSRTLKILSYFFHLELVPCI